MSCKFVAFRSLQANQPFHKSELTTRIPRDLLVLYHALPLLEINLLLPLLELPQRIQPSHRIECQPHEPGLVSFSL